MLEKAANMKQAMDDKKLPTNHVPTEPNIADIGDEGVDERQNMETDELDGNELGCWGGVPCAAARGCRTPGSVMDRVVKGPALKLWRRLQARGLRMLFR